jgi:pyrimidine-nucleoside phosphorylase
VNFVNLIESKRDGRSLRASESREIISSFTAGLIPDYQMSALLMAILFRGLSSEETRDWTLAMRDSGDRLVFPEDSRPLIDKHSTGGVGDKVSFPLVPLLVCLGFRVPMISGRGLGITGGTLDKIESIPGLGTSLSPEQIIRQVQKTGGVICAQSDRMVPADKRLYALRDVTGTVPSIPLIVASILSKKLAEGLQALVLDIKFGRAAFMQTREQAAQLARAMVALGNECGVKTRALLTGMDTPLGRAAGNWVEIKESVECLEGRGPADLAELVIELAAHLLVQTGKTSDLATARVQAHSCLSSGQPRRKWDELLAAQGADLSAFERNLAADHLAPLVVEIKADRSGFVSRCDARVIGELVRDLGAGRITKESVIHPEVGVDHLAKPGQAVKPGFVLGRVHALAVGPAEAAAGRLRSAFLLADEPPAPLPLIFETTG